MQNGGLRKSAASVATGTGLVLVLLCFSLATFAGCKKGRRAIEEAKQAHSAGRLDQALQTLKDVKAAPEASEAKELAVRWLLEAADRQAAAERKRLLNEAMKWNPQSGAAQARLCGILAEDKQFDELRACVDLMPDLLSTNGP